MIDDDFEERLRAGREELEVRKDIARGVLESLDGVPAPVIRLLAAALALSDGPISRFAQPLDCWADHVEDPERIRGWLAILKLSCELRVVAQSEVACLDLLDRLDGVDVAPWPAIAAAVQAVRDATQHRSIHP